MTRREQVLKAFRDYIGKPDQQFDLWADPKVPGTYAGRKKGDKGSDGVIEGFLITHSGIGEDDVEEMEFESWPPKSGPLRFFT